MKSTKDTILVVGHSPETSGVMCSFFPGVAAIELPRTHHPDLVLLDVAMENMEELDTCRQLQGAKGMTDVPVSFVTIMKEMFHKLEAGAFDYITKFVHTNELAARGATYLRTSQLRRNLELRHQEPRERTAQLETQRSVVDSSPMLTEPHFVTVATGSPKRGASHSSRQADHYWHQAERSQASSFRSTTKDRVPRSKIRRVRKFPPLVRQEAKRAPGVHPQTGNRTSQWPGRGWPNEKCSFLLHLTCSTPLGPSSHQSNSCPNGR